MGSGPQARASGRPWQSQNCSHSTVCRCAHGNAMTRTRTTQRRLSQEIIPNYSLLAKKSPFCFSQGHSASSLTPAVVTWWSAARTHTHTLTHTPTHTHTHTHTLGSVSLTFCGRLAIHFGEETCFTSWTLLGRLVVTFYRNLKKWNWALFFLENGYVSWIMGKLTWLLIKKKYIYILGTFWVWNFPQGQFMVQE